MTKIVTKNENGNLNEAFLNFGWLRISKPRCANGKKKK